MPLNLDLSSSVAKIARANEHFEALNHEIDAVLKDRPPYTARVDFDKESCCYSVVLCSQYFEEPHLGIVLGDFIHNLRSALDYVIAALVGANPLGQLDRQQFPIFDDASNYANSAPGMLRGVIYGLDIIERLQPFHRTPPEHDPLFILNYFSNSDKHRVLSGYYPFLDNLLGGLSPANGMIRNEIFKPPQSWRPNWEMVSAKAWYSPPAPKVNFEGKLIMDIHFRTPGIGKHPSGFIVPTGFFDELSKHVAMIVDLFKAL